LTKYIARETVPPMANIPPKIPNAIAIAMPVFVP